MNNSFVVSVDKINDLLSLVCQLHKAPIYVECFNAGIKVNFGVESVDCCFQLVVCLDDSIDLQHNNKGVVSLISNGDINEMKQTLNAIVTYEMSKQSNNQN